MRIAVVGAGISGLAAAHMLHCDHDVTVFESAGHIGGHTLTLPVETEKGRYDVDTGFVVYNEVTYPNFVRLLRQIGVRTRPTEMSFSVRCDRTGLEYRGSNVNTLFAQRRNFLRPSFYRLIREILRFNREAKALVREGVRTPKLRELLSEGGYSRAFVQKYIVPMGAAIWSNGPRSMLEFPAAFFLRFFDNHGLLSANGHLRWRTIVGGSHRYVEALVRPFRDRIRLRDPVRTIVRNPDEVRITTGDGREERFDHVILATHANRTLSMLSDATDRERDILGSFRVQKNSAVLHTDTALLPRTRRAWASWNYHVPKDDRDRAVVTYNMSRLQGLDGGSTFCLTLNRSDEIDPRKVIRRLEFDHPVYTVDSVASQRRYEEISGVQRTHYCGAYWGNGFHEDGVNSALAACAHFGQGLS